jgi:hypothetical protein
MGFENEAAGGTILRGAVGLPVLGAVGGEDDGNAVTANDGTSVEGNSRGRDAAAGGPEISIGVRDGEV